MPYDLDDVHITLPEREPEFAYAEHGESMPMAIPESSNGPSQPEWPSSLQMVAVYNSYVLLGGSNVQPGNISILNVVQVH
jgi:hypothetical protein